MHTNCTWQLGMEAPWTLRRHGEPRCAPLGARVQQISSRTFNLDANLALLRFYQFSPVSVRASVVAKVLVKAAMQLPAPDFKSCITLVPDRLQVGVGLFLGGGGGVEVCAVGLQVGVGRGWAKRGTGSIARGRARMLKRICNCIQSPTGLPG